MSRKIYLVNPAPDFPSYFNIEAMASLTGRPAAHIVALALPTVAALIPDDFEVEICDENVSPVDFDTDADFVGLTSLVSQWQRAKEIAREFRRRGKVVMIGGPHASLRPEVVRPHCDILVRGEIEEIAAGMFADLAAGAWKREYVGNLPDLSSSPLPRLDLYPNDRTLAGALQISRGCPFQCEFCDVIQYQGRRQRHKPIPQVLAELDQLRDMGFGHVFLVDDNLTAHRKRARALLAAIRDWNRRQDRRILFATQVSIDAAGDDEILELLVAAGVVEVFVGIETPNAESLAEVKKHHNNRCDVSHHVERFVEAGIAVLGGMVVGFDSDGPDIFERQLEFAMSLPVPVFTATALYAPETTPLHARLERAGRILPGEDDQPFSPWGTNIMPLQMTRESLAAGLRWLCNRLYEPRAFEIRLRRLVEAIDRAGFPSPLHERSRLAPPRAVDRDYLHLLRRLPRLGFAEARMVGRLLWLALRRRDRAGLVIRYLAFYAQIRHLFDVGGVWDETLGRIEEPPRVREPELAAAS